MITQKVLALPAFAEAGSVFSYVSVGKEPDTRAILREALKLGKKVFVPRCGPAPFMEAVRIRDLSELTRGRFGIPEPSGSEICTPDEPDLILVPCLSASGDGRRIGHGSGYYDAFLQAAEKEGYCLCYSAMLSDDIPIDEHDVRVKVITEDPDTSWKKNQ